MFFQMKYYSHTSRIADSASSKTVSLNFCKSDHIKAGVMINEPAGYCFYLF